MPSERRHPNVFHEGHGEPPCAGEARLCRKGSFVDERAHPRQLNTDASTF